MTSQADEQTTADVLPLGPLIFGAGYDTTRVMATLQRAPTLDHHRRSPLWGGARQIIDGQLTQVADQLLGQDAGDLLTSAWRLHEQVLAAARRTAAHPGTSELVDLVDETIEVGDRVDLDVTVNGAPLTSISIAVGVTLHIGRVRMLVDRGLLTSITHTNSSLAVELRIDDVPFPPPPPPVPLRPDVTRHFNPGVDLLGHSFPRPG